MAGLFDKYRSMKNEESVSRGTVSSSPELPRVLGIISIIGIVIGTMIGSGIFINPPKVAKDVGTPELMLAVWVVGGILSFFGALSLSELGAAFPQAGGIYIYLREAYGSLIAFLFGWTLFLVIDAGSVATLAVAFSTKYLPFFIPSLTPMGSKIPWECKIISVVFIAVLATVNYLGVKKGAFLMNFLTTIKFVALLGISAVIFIFAKGSASNFFSSSSPVAKPASGSILGGFGVALVAALWAYKGWETASFTAGEVKNPEKKLPLGILIGSVLVIILYLLANMAYLYVFPTGQMVDESSAIYSRVAAEAMKIAIGPIGASIVAFIILFSITGAANGHLLTGPRVYYAMAKDGLFFKPVAKVHRKFLTPHISIIALATWSSLLCLTGTFEQLFTYVVFGLWIFMGLTVAGVMILRKKKPDIPRPYKTWAYPITPILFILSALYLSINSLINTFWNSFAGLAIIFVGIPVYLYWKAKQK